MSRTRTTGNWLSWLKAYGLFTGGVIGVGLFGLPAALHAAGLWVFLMQVIVVGMLVWWLQRSVLDIVLATPGQHRIPGYARRYLGTVGFSAATIANMFGLFGALIAYLIAGGAFIRLVLEGLVPLSPLMAVGVYVLPGALLLLFGLRSLPALELIILLLFLVILGGLPLLAGDAFAFSRLPLMGETTSVMLPFGVLLFSLWGVSLIPETVELTQRRASRAASVLAAGLLTAVVAYVFFAGFVAGVTGSATTEDALSGLRSVLDHRIVRMAALFGILTTFSSYLAQGLTLLRTFTLDFKFPRLLAWAVTIGIPIAFVVFGTQSLLSVIALTGAVFLGIEGLIVLIISRTLERKDTRTHRLGVRLVIAGILLILGVAAELFRQFVL